MAVTAVVLAVAGAVLVAVGAALVFLPAGLIVAGIELLAGAYVARYLEVANAPTRAPG